VHFDLVLSVDPRAPARARAAIADALVESLPAERVQDGQLLVSELVTNSVVHAGLSSADTIGVALHVDAETVRVAVTDLGSGFERDTSKRAPDVWESGRGLSLVELLADRWGTSTAASTEVWFEIDR
jgi:anti-sigma regulatory factor (Ser/Thr protein kinase)